MREWQFHLIQSADKDVMRVITAPSASPYSNWEMIQAFKRRLSGE